MHLQVCLQVDLAVVLEHARKLLLWLPSYATQARNPDAPTGVAAQMQMQVEGVARLMVSLPASECVLRCVPLFGPAHVMLQRSRCLAD